MSATPVKTTVATTSIKRKRGGVKVSSGLKAGLTVKVGRIEFKTA